MSTVSIDYVVAAMKNFVRQSPSRNSQLELEFLYNLLSPAFIRMRVELIDDNGDRPTREFEPQNTQTRRGNVLPEPDFSHAVGSRVGRCLLNHVRGRSDFNHPIAFEANGIILDSDYNIIALPAPTFNPRFNKTALAENKYVAHRISDGTTITLYFYDGEWVAATANGFEVDHYKWCGETTYREAYTKALARYNVTTASLDVNYSYTIGFRDHAFHPLKEDPEDTWCVRVYNTSEASEATAEFYDKFPIPRQHTTFVDNVAEFLEKAAAEDAEGKIAYGYILRSPTANNKPLSNVIIEFKLLRLIRQYVYNMPKGQQKNKLAMFNTDMNHANRMLYAVVRTYLSKTDRDMFRRLFTQFAPEYKMIEETIDTIVNNILTHRRQKHQRKTKTPIEIVTANLYNCLSKQITIDLHAPETKDIVRDFVMDERYTDMYYCLLCAMSNKK